MNTIKKEIKAWLKKNKLSYKWLADTCLVEYNTVRNWLAFQKIPEKKIAFIQELMKESSGVPDESPSNEEEKEITLSLKKSEWDFLKKLLARVKD